MATRSFLQKVSWDLFFGACHFCSFEIVDLPAFTPKSPKIFFLLLFNFIESPIEEILLKLWEINTLKKAKMCKNALVVS